MDDFLRLHRSHSNDVVVFVTLTLLLGLVLGAILVFLTQQRARRCPFPGVPTLPRCHWLLGHALELLRRDDNLDFVSQQRALYEAHADPATGRTAFWLANTRGIVLTHATDVRTVLLRESTKHPTPLARHHLSHLLGPYQLGLLNGAIWKSHRSAISKALHHATTANSGRLHHVLRSVLQTATQSLIDRISRSSLRSAASNNETETNETSSSSKNSLYYDFDICSLMKFISIDTLGLSSLSHSFDCCTTFQLHEFAQAFNHVMGDVFRRMEHSPFSLANIWYALPTRANRAFSRQSHVVRSLVRTILQQHREARLYHGSNNNNTNSSQHSSTRPPSDLLDHLIQLHQPNDSSSSSSSNKEEDTVLMDVVLTVLFAGYDTISNTLSYALYLITQHPTVLAHVLEEISNTKATTTFHSSDDDDDTTTTTTVETTTTPAANHLVYTHACFEEALRLYPPGAVGNFRNLQRPMTLSSSPPLVLPAGALVLLPFWTVHRLEANFDRPLEFLPERWVRRLESQTTGSGRWVVRTRQDEDDNNNDVPCADRSHFFGFSAGARNCPGGTYATHTAVLVLAVLLDHFTFELLVLDTNDKPCANPVVVPERHGPVQRPKNGIPMRIRLRRDKGLEYSGTKAIG
jgi:cytochrome P450